MRTIRGLNLMNMRGSIGADEAPRQTLHIFVSNLKCTLYKKRKYDGKEKDLNESSSRVGTGVSSKLGSGISSQMLSSPKLQEMTQEWETPDPFVAFLSYPKRLVKEERTTWQRVESFFLPPGELRKETKDDGTISRTAGGWPRTKKLLSTADPDWSDEGEIHLKVKSHDKNGVPLNHTGSILYISAFNGASLDLSLIGSYAMNLGMLCSMAGSAKRSELTARSSMYLKNDSMTDMTSFEVYEPLLKNGRETGLLSCDIDACWLDDASSTRDLKHMKIDAKQKRLMKRTQTR